MIFQSLISLYDRLAKTEDVPPIGFSYEDIGFVLTIDEKGNLIGQPEDLRTKIKTNTYDFRKSVVPYTNKVNVRAGKGAAETANFMVDKADYIFGISGETKKTKHLQSFKDLIEVVCRDSTDNGVVAVKSFLNMWNPGDSVELEDWKEICGAHGKWVAFRLDGDLEFVHERREVKKLWSDYISEETFPKGLSLVDGKEHDIQYQYAQFKFGSGASIVSFNEAAYESYGKTRGENAPIAVDAEFRSSTALKYLFRSKSQRIWIGDTTVVFWAEKKSTIETIFGQIINPSISDQEASVAVKKFLEAVRAGILPVGLENEGNIKFYILGFSLNKARLALRFWFVSTVEDLAKKFKDHFGNLEMEPSSGNDIPYPGIWHLLKETARETKDISPVLGGALTRSILAGTNYPQNLYQGIIGRIRADHRINYLRVSILKAVLMRNHNKEVPMSLDKEKMDVAYLLGRLFAALEKAQLDALGKINASIKDRFFSAASATPASVFPRLLRLSQHHVEKAEYGYKSDQRIAEIMENINLFPDHMNLQQQGLFAIAYYQQKNAIDREIKNAAQQKKTINPKEIKMTNAIENRYEFVLLFDVKNGNPNGDPDSGNMPRIDPETGHGITTDVCLKRKIRNYVDLVKGNISPYEIHVREGAFLSEHHKRAHKDLDNEKLFIHVPADLQEELSNYQEFPEGIGFENEGLYLTLSTDLKKAQKEASKIKNISDASLAKIKELFVDSKEIIAKKWMCKNFYDVRTFGAVMSTGDKTCGQVRGPVQLGFAKSIDPIVGLDIAMFRTAAVSVDKPADKGLGARKAIVPYGLYRVHGFISAPIAKQTGFSEDDLELLWGALINMFDHDRSAARGEMACQKLIVFKHESKFGNAQAHVLFEKVRVERKDDSKAARAFSDYEVVVDTQMPTGVELLELP